MYESYSSEHWKQRVESLAPLVRRIAYHMMGRLPSNVEVDDLIQVGMLGLMEAAHNFNESLNIAFETFAQQRIRGAMLDELRALDWLPRQTRKQLKEAELAIQMLEQQLGRQPTEQEIAHQMKLPLAELQRIFAEGKGHQWVYLDEENDEDEQKFKEYLVADEAETPERLHAQSHFRTALVDAIRGLPEREALLMSLYYEQELNFKEIGAVLEVTESRVSQLHTQAISRIRASLRSWLPNAA